ncbi:DUF7507 domain-containing protein [Pimelobacter simplex]|uniref:Internalin, putative n=6 Tax=Nocardioides simplex TaxID=2045 RepID=A0A0C5XC04_NOCSI|nr:DUF11 domain-containing protein [Pimelobacter simplex]AJR18835.1 internalin, putative [Pimelobacter simplex]GEB16044.1 hypothetical protein NSI01_43590 [Pimelobacter simplex]SFM81801.1 conserved repeat domain-containing protein [Pimelobacter simplex]
MGFRSRRHRRRTGWHGAVVLALLAGLAASGTAAPLAMAPASSVLAAAAPGNPGVPAAPVQVFHEDFENGVGATASRLPGYTGAQGQTYTGAAFWTDQGQCNGVILQYASTTFPSGFCTTGNSAQPNVRRIADVLGQVEAGVVGSTSTATPVNGSTAATQRNHAVTAWTGNVNGADNQIVAQSSPFRLTPNGKRFYTTSVNVAEVSCTYLNGANNSRLDFVLLAGTQEIPVNSDPIRACRDSNVRYYTSPPLGGWGNGGNYVAAGRYYSDSSALIDTDQVSQLALRMRNQVGSSQGNDFGWDELRLFDATPQLDKAFSPGSVPVGGTSTLTFTVTNTSELAEKAGWAFTDALPDGLLVADPAGIGGTCRATTTATPGSSTITVADGTLAEGERSCTITVQVTSKRPGPADPTPIVFENGPDNLTTSGLNPPGTAKVEFFTRPELTLAKTSTGTGASRVGDTVGYTVTGTNTGTGNYTADKPAVVVDDLSGVLDDADLVGGSLRARVNGVPVDPPRLEGSRLVWEGPLPVDQDVVIDYDVVLKKGGDSRVANTAFPADGPYDGDDPPASPACGQQGAVCTEVLLPAITLDKSVDESSYLWNGTVHYKFVVTNTGQVPLSDVRVDETAFDGAGSISEVSCPRTTLAVGASMTCTATYTATGPDVDQGSLTNTATASGTPPAGAAVTSDPDSASVPADQQPALRFEKYADTNTIDRAGQVIVYRFRVYNDGNVTLSDIRVDEMSFTGTGDPPVPECPRTTLAAYTDMTCRATYTVTQDDVDNQALTNTAQARATTPDGQELTETDTVRTPGDPRPALTLVKDSPARDLVAGETIRYYFRVTNTGNVTMETPTIDELSFDGSGQLSAITCQERDEPFYPTRSVLCWADYRVTQADVDQGEITNTAVASAHVAGDDDPDRRPTRSNEASKRLPGTPAPGISLVKRADRDEIVVGQQVTYSFDVTNTGNVTLGNVAIDEWDFSGTGEISAISCPEGALAPDATTTCTATYTPTQADVDAGGISNTAVATATQPDGSSLTSTPSALEIPGRGQPELTLVKTADRASYELGDTITYTFTVTNTGNVTIDDVTVTEGSFTGSGDLSAITCGAAAASLAPDESVDCTATYEVTQADVDRGSVDNTATAGGRTTTGDDVTSGPADASVPADQRPAIAIEKSADKDEVVAGETIRYFFDVTNSGDVTLRDILVLDGQDFTGNGDELEILCRASDTQVLAPGATIRCWADYVVVQADVDQGGLDNTADASGLPPQGERVLSDRASLSIPADQDPALSLVKSNDATGPLEAGQQITYTFVVTNTGNVTMTDIRIREDAFTGTGTMPAATCTPDDLRAALPPGDQVTCSATYEVTQDDVDAGTIDNTASAGGVPPSGGDPVWSVPDSSKAPFEAAPAISLVKSASTDRLVAGETVTYSFRVTNDGNVTLSSVGIAEGSFTGSGAMSAIECPSGLLAPGASVTCTATYEVTQADVDAGSVRNTATAHGTPPGEGAEPVRSAPSSAELTAEAEPAVSLVKSASTDRLVAGEMVTYSFEVTNDGNVTLSSVGISEGAFTGSGAMSAIDCPPGALAPGDSVTCTATYEVTQADVDAGAVRNTATAHGTPPGEDAGPVRSAPSSAELTADAEPAVSLVKSASTDRLVAGEMVTYSFEVTNDGNVTLSSVGISEGSFTGSGAMSAIECPSGSLAPGDSVTCTATYEVTQADVDAGSVTNTATAHGTPPGDGAEPVRSDPSSAELTAEAAPALTLAKSADPVSDVVSGDVVTYSFLVTNTGNVTLTSVGVTEGSFSGSGAMSAIECPGGPLAPGGAVTCTATYEVTQDDVDAGSITNTATASGTPPGDDAQPVTSPPADAEVTADQTPSIDLVKSTTTEDLVAGETITYSFVVTNTGTVTLHDLAVSEDAFDGTGTLSAVSCPDDSLAAGAQTTCAATYTVTQDDVDRGTLTNTATASGTPPSGSPVASDPSSAQVPADPEPSVSLDKSASPATIAQAGETVTYSFVVTNTGNVTLHDVAIAEGAFSGTGALSAIRCPETRLVPGERTTCTATYEVTQDDVDAGSITNTATASGTPPGDGTEPVTSPPSDAEVTAEPAPAISLVKSAAPLRLTRAGETVTYSFVVTNTGNLTLRAIAVSEGSFSGTGEMSAISCPEPVLAPGEQETCTASYTVTQEDVDAGTLDNTATAEGTPPSGPPVTSDPSSAQLPAEPAPSLTLDKSASPATVARAGETVTYSFVVTNTGNVTLHDVAIAEGEFSGTGALSAIRCPETRLAPGERTTCTATYEVTQDDVDAGSITNTATASGTPPGDDAEPVTSPPDSATVTAPPAPSLSLVKSAEPTGLRAGRTVTYSFAVTNTGNVTLHDVAIDEQTFTGSGDLSAITCPDGDLAPGARITCVATYEVTQDDVDAGAVENSATATGSTPAGEPVTSPPSSVTLTEEPAAAIALVKKADRSTLRAGETVTYSFVVTNTGTVRLREVSVAETAFSGSGAMSAIACPAATLAPGDAMTCTATYVATQADVDAGGLTNTATATGTPPGAGPPVTSPPATVSIPVAADPGLDLVKRSDRQRFRAGDQVTYTFELTNTGNVTLHGARVREVRFSGSGPLGAVRCPDLSGGLAPGARVVCTATYRTTADDVRSGRLRNVAVAVATGPDGPVRSPRSRVDLTPAPQPPVPGLPAAGSPVPRALVPLGLLLLVAGGVLTAGGRRRCRRRR